MKNTAPGINHIEYWVHDLNRSLRLFTALFSLLGWKQLSKTEFSCGTCVFYFAEKPVRRNDSSGVRHVCFTAPSRQTVDQVARTLRSEDAEILRGPLEMPDYSEAYYTVDFRDPDGNVVEVAHTPNMTF